MSGAEFVSLYSSVACTLHTSTSPRLTLVNRSPTDSRDPDGDSEMASSTGSVHTDNDIAGNGARTPTHYAHAAAASELSPPGSQSQQTPAISAANDSNGAVVDAGQTTGQGPEQPVAAWKSKRAQDEYQRAMEHVIDKEFSLRM